MKNNKNVIMLLLICLNFTQIVMGSRGRIEIKSTKSMEYKPIEKSPQPSTAQIESSIGSRTVPPSRREILNTKIFDSTAETKITSNRQNLYEDEYTYNEKTPRERSGSTLNQIDPISPQPSTAQKYAIQIREKIGQFSPFENQGMIDAIAGTKGMSSPYKPTLQTESKAQGFRNEKISRPDENGIELITMNSKSDNQSTVNVIPKASRISQNEQDFDFLNTWENSGNESNNNTATPTTILQTSTSPFFEQSTEHVNISNTPPTIKTTPSFLQKTSDVINTWIGETSSAYSRNQVTAKTTAETSKKAQRPAADQIKINNQTYTQFLKDITYTDLFKNLTTSKGQNRSNGYAETNSIQPIVTDIVNKMLLDMQIPESVLTSPKFVNQQFKAMQTNFANQMQLIVNNTKLTLQEKQTQINQALTNLSQNVRNFFNELAIKNPKDYEPIPANNDENFVILSSIRPEGTRKKLTDNFNNPLDTYDDLMYNFDGSVSV